MPRFPRHLVPQVRRDLARSLPGARAGYLSGDVPADRERILRGELPPGKLGLESPGDLRTLLALGGFPEPFFGGSETEAQRWSRECRQRLRVPAPALRRSAHPGGQEGAEALPLRL
jgi:hypothetical protein